MNVFDRILTNEKHAILWKRFLADEAASNTFDYERIYSGPDNSSYTKELYLQNTFIKNVLKDEIIDIKGFPEYFIDLNIKQYSDSLFEKAANEIKGKKIFNGKPREILQKLWLLLARKELIHEHFIKRRNAALSLTLEQLLDEIDTTEKSQEEVFSESTKNFWMSLQFKIPRLYEDFDRKFHYKTTDDKEIKKERLQIFDKPEDINIKNDAETDENKNSEKLMNFLQELEKEQPVKKNDKKGSEYNIKYHTRYISELKILILEKDFAHVIKLFLGKMNKEPLNLTSMSLITSSKETIQNYTSGQFKNYLITANIINRYGLKALYDLKKRETVSLKTGEKILNDSDDDFIYKYDYLYEETKYIVSENSRINASVPLENLISVKIEDDDCMQMRYFWDKINEIYTDQKERKRLEYFVPHYFCTIHGFSAYSFTKDSENSHPYVFNKVLRYIKDIYNVLVREHNYHGDLKKILIELGCYEEGGKKASPSPDHIWAIMAIYIFLKTDIFDTATFLKQEGTRGFDKEDYLHVKEVITQYEKLLSRRGKK